LEGIPDETKLSASEIHLIACHALKGRRDPIRDPSRQHRDLVNRDWIGPQYVIAVDTTLANVRS
jgi:hypothetical protein